MATLQLASRASLGVGQLQKKPSMALTFTVAELTWMAKSWMRVDEGWMRVG